MLTQNITKIEIYSCNKTTVWLTVIKMCVNIVLDYIIIEREKNLQFQGIGPYEMHPSSFCSTSRKFRCPVQK